MAFKDSPKVAWTPACNRYHSLGRPPILLSTDRLGGWWRTVALQRSLDIQPRLGQSLTLSRNIVLRYIENRDYRLSRNICLRNILFLLRLQLRLYDLSCQSHSAANATLDRSRSSFCWSQYSQAWLA